MNDTILNLNEETFADALASDRPVVVDFWAEWCQPCHHLAPTLDALAVDYGDQVQVVKVDIDANPGLAETYQVRSIPTVLVIADGAVQARLVGLQPKSAYADAVDPLIDASRTSSLRPGGT